MGQGEGPQVEAGKQIHPDGEVAVGAGNQLEVGGDIAVRAQRQEALLLDGAQAHRLLIEAELADLVEDSTPLSALFISPAPL